MASLKQIRSKIKSVKSTQQITKAMKMVAAARMRKAQQAILSSRPFAVKLEEAVGELVRLELAAARQEGREGSSIHPFFESRGGDRVCLVLVTADKGLCGSFNTNVLRAAIGWLRRNEGRRISAVAVGRKGAALLRKLRQPRVEVLEEMIGIFPKVGFLHAEMAAKAVVSRFEAGELDSVTLLYNEFKSAVSQKVVEKQLLPIPVPPAPEGVHETPFGFHYEPGRERLLAALLPREIKAQVYRVLLESQAAELAARMNAMDSATKNAGELMDALKLDLNRKRQAIITREIMEIVSGAEALAS